MGVKYTQCKWISCYTKILFMRLGLVFSGLTHWGRVTHISVDKLTIISSDNIWTNAGTLLIGPFGTNPSEISIEIQIFSFKKMHLKESSEKWWPFCLGLNLLTLKPTPTEWLAVKSIIILGRELDPSGVSPNERSRWKQAFSPLKHV